MPINQQSSINSYMVAALDAAEKTVDRNLKNSEYVKAIVAEYKLPVRQDITGNFDNAERGVNWVADRNEGAEKLLGRQV